MKSRLTAAACVLAFATIPLDAALAAQILNANDTFEQDDDFQLFDLAISAAGIYDIRSFGYAGGTTSTGDVVTGGGFDTILTLFDDVGSFIAENDDASEGGLVANTDPGTDTAYDAWLRIFLDPGDYTVAVTQYDNYANGDLVDGFVRTGEGNYTPSLVIDGSCDDVTSFCDASGATGANQRTGAFLFEVAPAVPLPAAAWLFVSGLAGLAGFARRKRG
jgi:hypothetical protein